MLLVMALLVAQAQDSAKGPQPLKPLTSPGSWMTDDDYPPAAVRQGHEGIVEFQLQIDPSGLPAGCSIVRSSGFDELDQETCSLLMQRARFSESRERKHEHIARTYSSRMTWRLANDNTASLSSRDLFRYEFSADNKLLSCTAQSVVPAAEAHPCVDTTSLQKDAELLATGAGKHRLINLEGYFLVGEQPTDLTYYKSGQVRVSRYETVFETDATGVMTNCRINVEEGRRADEKERQNACAGMPQSFAGLHAAPGGRDGPLAGRVGVALSFEVLP